MINIKKKIIIMFLLVFAILSTTFAYCVNATESDSGFANEDVNGFIYYGNISGQYSNEYEDFVLRCNHIRCSPDCSRSS